MRVKIKKELLIFSVIFAAAAVLYFAIVKDSAAASDLQPQIADKILRFHVIADSDGDADQNVKLKVRDGVLDYLAPLFENCKDKADCEAVVSENMEKIKDKADEILKAEGFDDTVSVSLKERYFPVKKYGQYTFPEGKYEALCIEIGKAEGKNWWCVLYPRLCFIDSLYAVVPDESEQELKGVLSEEEYNAVFQSRDAKIQVKSRALEWIENFF